MRQHRLWFIAGFLTVPLALYAVFVLSPYAQAFYLSLTDWRGFSARQEFIGLGNYERLFSDKVFLAGLGNNLLLLVFLPVLTIGLGLFFASMLNVGGSRRRAGVGGVSGAGLYKIIYFFPQVLSVAVIAVLWQFVYNPRNGLLNATLDSVGLGSLRQSWLGDPQLALWAVLAVLVWSSVGFYVVLFSAAMQAIPRELYEAALLDGAGRLDTFRRITVPLLRENIQVAFVYLSVVALDGFAVVQIMTVGPGGPDHATEVVGLALYRNAFEYGEFGYAAAMGVALFFMTLTLAVLSTRFSRPQQVSA